MIRIQIKKKERDDERKNKSMCKIVIFNREWEREKNKSDLKKVYLGD